MDCLGCRLANAMEEVQIVYENSYVCCILDIDPFNEGHTLILPKQHVQDLTELDSELLTAIMEAAQKISRILTQTFQADGVSICQNGGIFNDLTHFHIHVIPRYLGDGFNWGDSLLPHQADKSIPDTRRKMVEAIKLMDDC